MMSVARLSSGGKVLNELDLSALFVGRLVKYQVQIPEYAQTAQQ